MRVLLLSRDPGWIGGIVNLVAGWKKNYSAQVCVDDFMVGDRLERRSPSRRYLLPFADAWRLFRTVRQERYDVVHINPSLNANSLLRDGLFMLVLRVTNQRVLVFCHGWDEELSRRIRASGLLGWLMRATFGTAQRILVLAGGFRDQLSEMGFDHQRIHTITTMFDRDQIPSLSERGNKSGRRILFLSRFVREKGMFELLYAFRDLVSEFPDAHLVMAGGGPLRDELQSEISSAGLGTCVTLPGYVRGEEKTRVLADADIFVLPTYYGEGCPVSMLEAMAAGLAIVATPVGGIPDILRDGENGVLLPSADPNLIRDALHRLLSEPEALATISATNRELAWQRYEAAVVTAEVENHYAAIVDSVPR